MPIDGRHTVSNQYAPLGTGKSHIKLTRIFHILRLVVVVDIRITPIHGIKHNHIVKLQALCLMHRSHVDILTNAPAVAEIALLKGVHVHNVTPQLRFKTVGNIGTGKHIHDDVA